MGTRRGYALSPVLFLVFLATTHAKQCNTGCVGPGGGVFKYEAGTTYKYELEGVSVTSLAGAESDVSKVTIKATAEVSALPNCAYSLSLSNVQVTGNDGKTSPGGKTLESKPVLFSMNNGIVSSEICTAGDEEIASLNIKRAVISLLQSSGVKGPGHSSKNEVDVFGDCPTEVDVTRSGKTLKVKKTRNINSCQHRSNFHLPIIPVEYKSISDFQSSPLLSGILNVDQSIEGGILKSASSEEVYLYTPVSTIDSGAKVTVSSKLKFISSSKGAAPPSGANEAHPLIFESVHKEGEDYTKLATKIFKGTCEGSTNEVKPKNAKAFAFLVRILSKSNKATLNNLFKQVTSGSICSDKEVAKKIFFDAVSQSHSAAGVELMAELLKNKEVTGNKAMLWYVALGLVDHASLTSVKATLPLLNDDAPLEAYLGIGMLVGKYCADHSCEGVAEINQAEKKLAAPLLKGCKTSNVEDEDKLIASLKGLRNTRFLSQEVVSKLVQCAADHSIKSRIRVAALDTLKTDPDKELIKKTVINILKDKNEDSEIRINAYLIVVECPCPKMAAVVQEVLDKEESYQVGGYIVSHLRNLRATKDPNKAKASLHFSKVKTSNKFPFDPKKYSLNHELSYMFETLNLGLTEELDVIYSQKSWIPRSGSLNITTQLFGKSWNLLEIDARAENLERLFEKVLGPKGYFHTASPNDVTSEASSLFGKFMAKAKQTIRPKRGVSRDQLNAFDKKVNMGVDAKDTELNLDLSFKMYGSEVSWLKFHGGDIVEDPNVVIDNIFGFLDKSIDKAKNIDFDYKKHALLLDGTVEYPTGMGLPLKLDIVASSAVRVKFDGKFDLPAILKDPKNAVIRFQFIPSASTELASVISVDATLFESGLKLGLNIHSSTGSDLTARILDGKGIDVKVGLPISKQDVITAETEIFGFTYSKDSSSVQPVKYNVKREEYSGCFDQISEIFGLTFCGEISVPWDGHRTLSPAYGPSKLSVHIEKEDESISSFHFKALYNTQKESPQQSVEILFDVPNSKKDRKISVNLEHGESSKNYVKALVHSPWGGAKFEGSIVNKPTEQSINAELNFADQEYSFKAGLKGSGGGNTVKYEPFLEYKAPEKAAKALVGRRGGQKQAAPISISGEVVVDKGAGTRTYTFNSVKVTSGRQDYILDGTISGKQNSINADLKVKYDKETIVLKGQSESTEDRDAGTAGFKRHLQVVPSQYPDFGFDIKWDFNRLFKTPNTVVEGQISVVHGPDPNSETARITLKNHFKHVKGTSIPTIVVKNSLTYPIVGLNGVLNFNSGPKAISYDIEGAFDKYSAGSSLNAKIRPKGQYDVTLTGKMMANSIHLSAKRDAIDEHKSKFTNSLEVQPGGKYQLNALVTHQIDPDDLDVHVDAKITLPTEPKLVEVKSGLKNNDAETEGTLWTSVGGKVYIDAKGKFKKGSTPSGNFKINVPTYLDSNGDFKMTNNVFDGKAIFNLPKVQKKIDAKARMTSNAPKYQGYGEVCMDSKCLKVTTNTQIDSNSYDSTNNAELGDLKLTLKAKHDHAKGTLSAQGEFHLPKGRNLKASYSQALNIKAEDTEAEYLINFEDLEQGKKPTKLSAKLVGKHVDLDKLKFDGQMALTYTTPEEKDLSIHTNLKKMPAGDKWAINGEIGIDGSLIDAPLKVKLDSDISDKFLSGDIGDDLSIPPISYHLTASSGNDVELESNGKANTHTISGDVALKIPSNPNIKQLKWTTVNVIDLVPREGVKNKFKTSNTFKWGDNKFFKSNVELNEEEHGLNYKFDWEGDNLSKRSVLGNGHFIEGEGDAPCKADGRIAISWDGKTSDVVAKAEVNSNKNEGSLHLSGTLPDQRKYDFQVKGKEILKASDPEGRGFHGDLTATIGSEKFVGSSKVELFKNNPLIDIILDHPEGRSQFRWTLQKKSEKHWYGDATIKWTINGGGSIIQSSEINFESPEEFLVNLKFDSPKLNINKLHVEASGKPNNEIAFSFKSADKVLAGGKTSYSISTEDNKKSVEGSGTLTIDGKDYPLNFNGYCEKLDNGAECKLNAKSDKRSLAITSKMTPTEYVVKRKYCKDTSVCSEALVSSIIKENGPMKFDHSVNFKVDFSLFNPELPDFKLFSFTKRDGIIFDQTVDVEWSPKSKLKYVTYVHTNKAGTTITLPKRTIAAEASYVLPKQNKLAVKAEASLWLDKANAPNKRAHLLVSAEAVHAKDAYTVSGDAKFSHPLLSRPFVIKGKSSVSDIAKTGKPQGEGSFEVDIFKTPQQKIVGNWKGVTNKKQEGYDSQLIATLKSDGLGLDITYDAKSAFTKSSISYIEKLSYVNAKKAKRDFIGKMELTPKKLHILSKIPDATLFEVISKFDANDNGVTVQDTYNVYGVKYVETFEMSKSHFLYKFISSKACGNKVFNIEGDYNFGKAAKLSSSYDNKPIASLDISLEEAHFLKPTYQYDTEVAKTFMKCMADEYKLVSTEALTLKNKLSKAISEEYDKKEPVFRNAIPDVQPLVESYSDQLAQIQEEILSDETLQGTLRLVKSSLSTIIEQVVVFMEETNKLYSTLVNELKDALQKLNDALKQIIPKLNKSFEEVAKAFAHMLEEWLNLVVQISDIVLDEIKAHEEQIKAVLTTVTDALEEFGKIFAQFAASLNSAVQEFVKESLETLKELPIAEMIKEQLENLKEMDILPIEDALQSILELVEVFLEEVKEVSPTPELRQLISTLINWVKAVLKKEKVNHNEYLKKTGDEAVAVVKPLIALLYEQFSTDDTSLAKAPLPSIGNLPFTRFPPGVLKISVLSWLLSKDLPSPKQIIGAILPPANPTDWVPPYSARGFLLGGSEIITFDGHYLNLQGTCQFILTEDYIDGNFSVIASVQDGKLQSIQVTDAQDTVELRNKKRPLVNGKESEFPALQGQIKVWKRPAIIGLKTKAGLAIKCTHDFSRCKLKLSGYYFGKVRGLLGTYNYEQYEDLTLPNGEVSSDPSKFLQEWSIGSCNAKSENPNSKYEGCTEMFNDTPEFLFCFELISPKPFYDACNKLVEKEANEEGKKAAVCSAAVAYTAACQTRLPTLLPDSCLFCEVEGKGQVKVGTEFIMEPPYKKADIVFVVERIDSNKEVFETLVVPLVNTLTNKLKAKGFNDIKYGLVGTEGKAGWPAYYTLNGKIMNNGINTKIPFDPVPKRSPNENPLLKFYNDYSKLAIIESGFTKRAITYADVPESYEFRPGAARTVIGVHSTPCLGSFIFGILQHLFFIGTYANNGIVYNMISTVSDMELPGQDVNKIVGFNIDKVFLLSDTEMKGNEDLESNFEHTHDVCHTFAEFTGGTVFSANNYLSAAGGDKKAMEEAIATGITNTLASQDDELDCECEMQFNLYDGYYAKTECSHIRI